MFITIYKNRIVLSIVAILCIVSSMLFIDIDFYHFVNTKPQWLKDISEYVTRIGKLDPVIVPAFLYTAFVFWKMKKEKKPFFVEPSSKQHEWAFKAGLVFLSMVVSAIITGISKALIGRARPKFFEEYGTLYFKHFSIGGYDFNSFPSGHTTTAFALMLSLAAIFPQFRWLLIGIAFLTALTRPILNAHYLSDIMAGAFIATIVVTHIYIYFINKKFIKCDNNYS